MQQAQQGQVTLNQRTNKKHHTQLPTSQYQATQLPIRSLHQGLVIANRFKLLEKIGQGSFGSIFKTENLENRDICATKFEKREDKNGGISLLVREIKVLMEMKGSFGFPQISFYGRDEHYNYFMVNLLGYNFESLIRKCQGKFSLGSTLQIALQILSRIEMFHSKNLIHRDIKPENFVIGENDIQNLYLIDFGLSKYYRDSNGKHIPWMEKKGIIGTARYASLNAHLGNEQSRRDDLEGIGYILVYFAKGKLPWMNIQIEEKSEKYAKIMEIKQQTSFENLCSGLPVCFLQYFQHIKTLQFTDTPNYALIKGYFQTCLQELDPLEQCSFLDWELLQEFKNRNKIPQKQSILLFNVQTTDQQVNDKQNGLQSPGEITPTIIKEFSQTPNDVIRSKDKDQQQQQDEKKRIDKKRFTANVKITTPFLIVPIKKDDRLNKGQKSIAESRALSIRTSKKNQYQISQIEGEILEDDEQLKQVAVNIGQLKRIDNKALTINSKGISFLRTAKNPNSNNGFEDFDNIHEIADDDPHLSISNFKFSIQKTKNQY